MYHVKVAVLIWTASIAVQFNFLFKSEETLR